MKQITGLFDAVGGIDDDNSISLRFKIHDARAGAEDWFD